MAKDKKPTGKKIVSIEQAVALFLGTRNAPLTVKQCLKELLSEVKKEVANDKLTLQNLKKSLEKWFKEGWALVNDGFLQITRAGRAKIRKLAEDAVSSEAPTAAEVPAAA